MSHHTTTRQTIRLLAVALAAVALAAAAPLIADEEDSRAVAKLIQRAARQQSKGDYQAAVKFFAEADRAADGRSLHAVAGLCQASLELGRYDEAITAAERWIELAGVPAERAGGYHYLGLALFRRGMSELNRTREIPGRVPVEDEDDGVGRESLLRAAEAFRHAADLATEGRHFSLLSLADVLVRLGEHGQALEVLDDYSAVGGADSFAEDLRCWSEFEAESAQREAVASGGEAISIGDVTAPVKLFAPQPQYTEQARKARVQGTVAIGAIVDEEGKVACARALNELPMGLGRAALDAVKRWRFEPGRRDGVPEQNRYDLTVSFSLGGHPRGAGEFERVGERTAATAVEVGAADGFPQRESLLREAEALRLVAAETSEDRHLVLLSLADTLVGLGEYREALKVLDEYVAAGGEDPRAEDLRCWSGYAAKRSVGGLGAAGGGVYTIDGAVEPPEPKMPRMSQTIRLLQTLETRGPLSVRMIIDEKGRVACARLLAGSGRRSDTALDFLKNWPFKPALLNGVVVPVYYDTTFGLVEGREARRVMGLGLP